MRTTRTKRHRGTIINNIDTYLYLLNSLINNGKCTDSNHIAKFKSYSKMFEGADKMNRDELLKLDSLVDSLVEEVRGF